MNSVDMASLLRAHRTGNGKWVARCPAHADSSPSLSIREGRDGRVLLHCFAGCDVEDVLNALGLAMGHLFAGPPPSATDVARIALERETQLAQERAVRSEYLRAAATYRGLVRATDAIGEKLAHTPNGTPEANELARLFHKGLARQRTLESEFFGETHEDL